RYNLLFNPLAAPALLVDVHVDTVAVTLEGVPCRLHQDDYTVYGRGAVDAKGSVVAVLAALRSFLPQVARTFLPFTVAFTVDEEDAGLGSEALAAALRPKAVLVLEPTGLALCPAQAGSLVVRLNASGQAVHGSEFEQGRNACQAMLEALAQLPTLSFLAQAHPLLGQAGYNLRYLRGGTPELVVPQACEAIIDFRLLPQMELAAVQEEVAAFWRRMGLTGEIVELAPPYALAGDEEVIGLVRSACKEVTGEEPALAGFKSWTDGENFYAAGVPAVIWGPGQLAVAHTPQERIDLREVLTAARVLEAVWRKL
ncbi:MAG: M20/M25/M40 family metallo-hydrolase, partial [Clostridia bacterium]|nr:M20/M25/M40 family metallo-hydrolase [Clostridia bacterium]